MVVSENSFADQGDSSTRHPNADDQQLGDVRDILLSITRETVGSKDLKALLQTIVDTALTVIPSAEKSVIHLLDATTNRLIVHVCSDPWPVRSERSGMPARVGIAGQALSTKQVICVGDTNVDGRYAPLGSGSDIRSLLVAPLLFRDLQLGTLSLSSARAEAFRPIDIEYVAVLAAEAAGAIHQMKLLNEATGQRQRSDAIISQMFDGLLIVADNGQIQRTNPALRQMLGLDAKAQDQVEPTADDPYLSQLIDPRGEIIGSYCVQLPIQGKGNTSLQICPSVRPIGTDHILVIRNITAEREASDRRAFFIAQISHELRTPLQHIMSSVSLINDIDDLSPEDRHRFLQHIEDETYHLGKLVDDLVALSRIEVGHFDVFLEPVRMDELLATVMDRLEPRAESNRLRMLFEPERYPVWAFTDPLRLEQVLLNVLTNACKYAPKGSEIRTILQADTAIVAVRISDQGPGIPQEAIEYIFDPFSRLASNAHIPGMGLGLYISQQIIQILGGEIAVNSTLGKGSTFALQIPRRLDLLPAHLRNQG